MQNVRVAALRPSDVYRYYCDPATWGQWGHNPRWARLVGLAERARE